MNVTLPKLMSYQKEIVSHIDNPNVKILVFKKSRQIGGSFLNKLLCIKWLLQKGEKIAYITPTLKLAKDFYNELTLKIPYQLVSKCNGAELKVTSITNSTLQFFSAESDAAIRGFQFTYMIIDEAAFQTDKVYYEILRATMLVRGKTILMCSTPNGEAGFFYDNYVEGKINNNPAVKVIEANIFDNPFISDEDKLLIQNTTPVRVWRQEYLAEFLSNGSGIFDYKNSLLNYTDELTDEKHTLTVAGLDLGKQDRTVLTILNKAGRMINVFEWSNMSYIMIIDNIIKAINKYSVKSIVVESNSVGDAVIDMMKEKMPRSCKLDDFYTSNKSKNDIMESLMLSFESGKILILNNDKLKHQLDSMGVEYNHKTRTTSYVNKRDASGHSDYVMSLAFANKALEDLNHTGKYVYRMI